MKMTLGELKSLLKESLDDPAAQLLDKVVATIEEEGGSVQPFDYSSGHHPQEYRATTEITNKQVSMSTRDAITRSIGERPRTSNNMESRWLTTIGGSTAIVTLFGDREIEIAVPKPKIKR